MSWKKASVLNSPIKKKAGGAAIMLPLCVIWWVKSELKASQRPPGGTGSAGAAGCPQPPQLHWLFHSCEYTHPDGRYKNRSIHHHVDWYMLLNRQHHEETPVCEYTELMKEASNVLCCGPEFSLAHGKSAHHFYTVWNFSSFNVSVLLHEKPWKPFSEGCLTACWQMSLW